MKKTLFLVISSMLIAYNANAQLKVGSDGRASIARSGSNFVSDLFVGSSDIFNSSLSNKIGIVGSNASETGNSNIGVEGSVQIDEDPAYNYGVMGVVTGTTSYGYNYGVSGMINTTNGAGVFGSKWTYPYYYPISISGKYAGYFDGQVYVSGALTAQNVYTTSDSRLKENVVSLEETDDDGRQTLQNVLNMNVVEYNLKNKPQYSSLADGMTVPEEELQSFEEEKKKEEALASKRHIGLIAQELQAIYPDMVQEDEDGYLSVNYTELVPVLIRSIQILKEELDAVKCENSAKRLNQNATGLSSAEDNGNKLFQNTPNPFTNQTTIKFNLSNYAKNAFICIFDMTGKMLKQIPVTADQNCAIIQGHELTAGIYLYSLVVNGQEIDTKRMILSK